MTSWARKPALELGNGQWATARRAQDLTVIPFLSEPAWLPRCPRCKRIYSPVVIRIISQMESSEFRLATPADVEPLIRLRRAFLAELTDCNPNEPVLPMPFRGTSPRS